MKRYFSYSFSIGTIFLAAITFFLISFLASPEQARAEWVKCADENGYCYLEQGTDVRYGARGTFAMDYFGAGRMHCSNNTFGDPLYGVRKACFKWVNERSNRWVHCAKENDVCRFRGGSRQVRYGARGEYAYVTARSPVACNNQTFGDPLYGVVKDCWVLEH
ncbi:hypothetical protein CSC94_19065 [Zhengella mangrovi]|uniref:DUF3011 domain-containing protein n=1 Tax=Zhengella mangrovi TaxID=1982044 RepID=A0A2G1QJQ5_9HYPH|nr:hypothetical protein [Zhengella mangrovi]PHP65458.1 hypothetical protein CSC94_19065 [Zhengella mangrovi]